MKVGTICYATSRGLGHLAKGFYDHGLITDVCTVQHPSVPTNWEWYPNTPVIDLRKVGRDGLTNAFLRQFCEGEDAMLFFETPFDWSLMDHCRGLGVRTYLVTMYECTPAHHSKPYKYLCPSRLDLEYFPGGQLVQLPVEYPWRQRVVAEHFVHNGGYLGLRGREGTTILIDAMQYVKSPIRLTIRVQENVSSAYQLMMAKDKRIEYVPQCVSYEQLYGEGDVAVMPQKFNGCSLPLMEAYASGMLVMTTNRFPANTWLPNEPMIPVAGYNRGVQVGGPYMKFDEAIIEPRTIAETIDAWYGRNIEAHSLLGKYWAEANSWDKLVPTWKELLSR